MLAFLPKGNAVPFMPASNALSHLTVLDLSRVRSGPTCVRQLADWGANVIMVEMPSDLQGGDAPGGARHGPDFQNLHRNKRSISLNLKKPEGRRVLLQLIKRADVLVENFRPDVKHRLGIDYDSVAAIRPEIVYASISGFGQTGPYESRPGFDQIAQGLGGIMSITGEPGGGPMRVGIPLADLTAGLYCAIGVLVALVERGVTGKGQRVETSLLEAQVAMLDFQAARWLIDGDVPRQAGNNHPTMLPTGVFNTSDGTINIAVTGAVMWGRFCKALDAADLFEDQRFKSAALRLQNRDDLNDAINLRLRAQPTEFWMGRFAQEQVPVGPIHTIDQVFADEQVQHLKMSKKIRSDTLDRDLHLVRQPVSLSRSPSDVSRPAPTNGEHTDEVLAEFGFETAEIERLRLDGVV